MLHAPYSSVPFTTAHCSVLNCIALHCAGVHHPACSDSLCPTMRCVSLLCSTQLGSVLSVLYSVLCVRSSPNHRYTSQHITSYHIAALCSTSYDSDEILSDLEGQCSWEDRVLKNVPRTSF